jgi:hypothetical protein
MFSLTNRVSLFPLVAAMSLLLAGPTLATAKGKKLTYDQAWAHCKALLDKEKTPGTTTQANERMVRGGACMNHYGYKL